MDKNQWHRKTTALLASVARKLAIPTNARKIRSNKGGPAVGGEVTMSAPEFGVYVHLACPVNAYGERDTIGANYMRRATPQDPYGTGMDKPNRMFSYASDDCIVELVYKLVYP